MMPKIHNLFVTFPLLLLALLVASCTGTATEGGSTGESLPYEYYITGTGSTTLTWEAPTENTDNMPVTLGGFVIYFGPASGSLAYSVTVNDAYATSYTVQNLRSTTYMFGITAFDDTGVESDLSNIVNKIVIE